MKASEQKAKQKLKDVEAGKIMEKQYKHWLQGQVFISERSQRKLDDITNTT